MVFIYYIYIYTNIKLPALLLHSLSLSMYKKTEGVEIDIKGDMTIFPNKCRLRIVGESYLERLREVAEFEEKAKAAAEEKRVALKKRVSRLL